MAVRLTRVMMAVVVAATDARRSRPQMDDSITLLRSFTQDLGVVEVY